VNARPPDFGELVDGPDLEPGERDRLRRVHDALVAAGPPPELPSALADAPAPNVVPLAPRRRRGRLIALAAALAAAAFAVGYVVAEADEPDVDRVVAMSGPSGATASIDVFAADDAGNWPMEIEIEGLPSDGKTRYELWLTRDGELASLCGTFLLEVDGKTVVPMNAPWRLDEFDGWVVVEQGSDEPLLTT
jgi:Anti-sigma-K factor rskA